ERPPMTATACIANAATCCPGRQGPSSPAAKGKIAGSGVRNSERRAPRRGNRALRKPERRRKGREASGARPQPETAKERTQTYVTEPDTASHEGMSRRASSRPAPL